jgi:hypothetical protein
MTVTWIGNRRVENTPTPDSPVKAELKPAKKTTVDVKDESTPTPIEKEQ